MKRVFLAIFQLNHSNSPGCIIHQLSSSDFPNVPSVQMDPSSPMAGKRPTFLQQMGRIMGKFGWESDLLTYILPEKMGETR